MQPKTLLKIKIFIILAIILFISNHHLLYVVFVVANGLLFYMFIGNCKKTKMKLLALIFYPLMNFIQVFFVHFLEIKEYILGQGPAIKTLIYITLLSLSFIVDYYIEVKIYQNFYFPNNKNTKVFSFQDIKKISTSYRQRVSDNVSRISSLSPSTVKEVVSDWTRHNSFQYINNDSIGDDYVERAFQSLNDEYVYIVISDTGSPASQLISVFTNKMFNHASISFDYDLKTLVSYNGGENISPPGLNMEMIEYFCKKDDSSILIYRLHVGYESKKKMIEEVIKINNEGSAYNLLGLVLHKSFKPNIMYCSQFVYRLLEVGDATYFKPISNSIRPTDFIELDYYRNLEYCYTIDFKS